MVFIMFPKFSWSYIYLNKSHPILQYFFFFLQVLLRYI